MQLTENAAALKQKNEQLTACEAAIEQKGWSAESKCSYRAAEGRPAGSKRC